MDRVDQDVDQMRSLATNLGHELRTPIAALQAVLENLVDGVTQPDPRTLESALEQAQRLGKALDDVLLLGRIRAGIFEPSWNQIAFSDLVFTAAADMQSHLRQQVRISSPASSTQVVIADSALLRYAVRKLLVNAAQRGPSDRNIDVIIDWTADGSGILDITDYGPALSDTDRPNYLRRFTHITSNDGNTGIDLALAQSILDLHGFQTEMLDVTTGACVRCTIPPDKIVARRGD